MRARVLVASALVCLTCLRCSESTRDPLPASDASTAAPDAAAALPDSGADAGDVAPAVLPASADTARLTAFVRDLSHPDMCGRLTGTASGNRAEAYLKGALARTELEVVTQEVVFPMYEVLGPARLAVLGEGGEPDLELAYLEEFREVDFSGSGAVVGDLVFVGYGVSAEGYDDYAGLDVTGKVVALLTGVPSTVSRSPHERLDHKIHTAWRHGAKAVVVVLAGPWATSANRNGLAMQLRALGPSGVDASLHRDDVPVVFVHLAATASLLGRSAAELAMVPAPFDAQRRVAVEMHGTSHPQATCRNVLGVHRGTDPSLSDEVIILGAHYDHLGKAADGRVFTGAADNASGTAVVLEAATALATSRVPPKRTMVYAFWCAEELGLFGSTYYTDVAPLFPLESTVMMLQVDYLGDLDGPYLTNVDDNEVVKTFLGREINAPTLPILPLDLAGGCASDDCPFLAKAVPSYRFLCNGSHHHTPADTFENLKLEHSQRVADVVVRGLGTTAYRSRRN